MAAAIVLQKLHGLSDRDTAEAVRCDMRWKVLRSCVDRQRLSSDKLLNWRRRLAASEQSNRSFDAVRELIAARECSLARPAGRWIRRC